MKSFPPPRQRGAALMIVLILLLVMTLLGLVSARVAQVEERMGASQYDRSLAFQAAEAALRRGEAVAAARPTPPGSGCNSAGICAFPLAGAAPRWRSAAIWTAAPTVPDLVLQGPVGSTRYIVELLADQVPPRGTCTTVGDVSETQCAGSERRYRITARSQAAGRVSVMLQSIYAVP